MREKIGVIRRKRTWLAAGILSLTLMTSSVFAWTESNPYPTGVHNGYSYNITSITYVYGSGSNANIRAMTDINKSDSSPSGNVPAGYMGAQARIYNEKGELYESSEMKYNPSPTVRWSVETSGWKGEKFYSQGKAMFYNANGTYTEYTAYKSPLGEATFIQNSKQIDYIKDKYAMNINGDTYGSAVSSNTDPDLILAVGTNGISGYVKSSDLVPEVDSPEAALEQNKTSDRTIPLYDVNGETQIGVFKLVTIENELLPESHIEQ
ncbi:peptidase [Paenibacillus sp. MSJ-34]|uniref:peptidase n=1 Tax=Paenibacillus sp. MSJ-34 TaxID=2841529 RepID=UPI001C10EEE7|nr:peptidase [Paenibacillus sp. MSJ-34]MBU5442748.1 peptidase [Paenibacillus sp. MSJ-34]